MATSRDRHIKFDKKFHEKTPCGCVWRHKGGHGETDCHYAMNGFKVSGDADRRGLYNADNTKDYRGRAKELGYAVDRPAGKRGDLGVGPKVRQALARKSKSDAFRDAYERKFGSSLKWLSLSSQGWNYGYLLPAEHVPKNRPQGRKETFAVKKKDSEGYGAWYPYHHNYHHMVSVGAFHEYVIGEAGALERIRAVVASGWNINKGLNIVLLPQEVFVAKIVGLPAHCPWGSKSHRAYSRSLKNKLDGVKEQLNKAVETEACEDAVEVACRLDSVCKLALKQIRAMPAGKKLVALR